MAHIFLLFDFAQDEEKAQQARHKLEGWKQAFRLDKKLLYKLERTAEATAPSEGAPKAAAKPEKPKTKAKGKEKAAKAGEKEAAESDEKGPAESSGEIKLLVRLAFSGHEKLTEQRWLQRIPAETPFQEASPQVVKAGDANFEATGKQFDELA